MTLRAFDVRYLLPFTPRSIHAIGAGFEALLDAAASLGINDVDPAATEPPDLSVCRPKDAIRAFTFASPMIVVRGMLTPRAARAARRNGYKIGRYHAWGHPEAVRVFVPADDRPIGRRLVGAMTGTTLRSRVRKAALRVAVELAASPPSATVTICAQLSLRPALLAEAADPPLSCAHDGFHLDCGDGDDLQRAVFHLYDSTTPQAALKFSRVPDNVIPFERDEAGLHLIAECPADIARHAPRLLGRGSLDHTPFSVESHAAGQPLSRWLDHDPHPRWVNARVDDITGWIEALQRSTTTRDQHPIATIAMLDTAEMTRERRDRLVEALMHTPTVLSHADLGSWNILVDDLGFTVVDWEGATTGSPPLWDLWYFLADVSARRDERHDVARRVTLTRDVFAGRHPRSGELMAATQRVCAALEIDRSFVGPLLAACWLTHEQRRLVRLRATAASGEQVAPLDHVARLAGVWFDDPDLGVDWPAYERFVGA